MRGGQGREEAGQIKKARQSFLRAFFYLPFLRFQRALRLRLPTLRRLLGLLLLGISTPC